MLHKTGRFVDIAGIENHTLNDLEIVTAAGVVSTTTGQAILILHQYAYLGQGKTIHSAAQIEHYKIKSMINLKCLVVNRLSLL